MKKYRSDTIARLKREEKKRKRVERDRKRAERKVEIEAILKECHATSAIAFASPYRDLNLENLSEQYVLKGYKETLIKFTEDAKEKGVQIPRYAEVDNLMEVNGVGAEMIDPAERVAYAKTGDNDILERIQTMIARSVEVNKLMKVNGVKAKTINAAERVAYAETGENDILERIKTMIQVEVRKNARRAEVVKLMKVNFNLTKTVTQSDREGYATT